MLRKFKQYMMFAKLLLIFSSADLVAVALLISFIVCEEELGLLEGSDKQWNITRGNFALCFYSNNELQRNITKKYFFIFPLEHFG